MVRLAGYLSGIAVAALLLGAALEGREQEGPSSADLKTWVASRFSELERWIGRVPRLPVGDGDSTASTDPDEAPVTPVTSNPGQVVEPVASETAPRPPPAAPGEDTGSPAGRVVDPATPEPLPVVQGPPAVAGEDPPAVPLSPAPVTGPEEHWQALWIPFRTQASARGFAGRVSRLTSVPVKVEPADRGYQVMFAYQGADQREATLARIASATGLRLEDR